MYERPTVVGDVSKQSTVILRNFFEAVEKLLPRTYVLNIMTYIGYLNFQRLEDSQRGGSGGLRQPRCTVQLKAIKEVDWPEPTGI